MQRYKMAPNQSMVTDPDGGWVEYTDHLAAVKVFVPRYSGNKSRDFWRCINAIKGEDRWVAYSLGVALQNIEQQLLHILNGGIKIVVKREASDGK